MWIHDLEVSNRDECVTIKNPAKYMLIENIYCNWSGGECPFLLRRPFPSMGSEYLGKLGWDVN